MESKNQQQGNFRGAWRGDYKKQQDTQPPQSPQNAPEKNEEPGPKIKSFKELIVWQKGFVLVKDIYAATATFPREELYGLVSQLRRSAVSVPSNIAEGFRRRFQKELKQFLNIALGSLAEIETQLAIAGELGYLKPEVLEHLNDLTDQVIRLAIGLSKKV